MVKKVLTDVEHFSLLKNVRESYAVKLSESKLCSPETLRALSQHDSLYVHFKIVQNDNAPVDVINFLYENGDVVLRRLILSHHAAPEHVFCEENYVSINMSVIKNLAKNVSLPVEGFNCLAENSNVSVLEVLAENSSIPAHVFMLLVEKNFALVDYLSRNNNVPLPFVDYLLNKNLVNELFVVVSNKAADTELLEYVCDRIVEENLNVELSDMVESCLLGIVFHRKVSEKILTQIMGFSEGYRVHLEAARRSKFLGIEPYNAYPDEWLQGMFSK